MTVTPQISESDVVLLNVRPSISRISGIKNDPNPNIPAGLVNAVPEIETREMESVLRLNNGEIAVMGGLMQDAVDHTTHAVPGLADIPLIGNFFRQRDETSTKTELVVFLRPIVIRDPSVRGDFLAFRDRLPDRNFFAGSRDARTAGRAR
jgi:general secretion pathway protein D